MPAIKIISLKDGFRRCGIEHPAKPVTYPEDAFTEEQIKKLMAEPMLVVEEVDETNTVREKEKGAKKTGPKGQGKDPDKTDSDNNQGNSGEQAATGTGGDTGSSK